MFNLSPEIILVKFSTRILAAANFYTFKNLKNDKAHDYSDLVKLHETIHAT